MIPRPAFVLFLLICGDGRPFIIGNGFSYVTDTCSHDIIVHRCKV